MIVDSHIHLWGESVAKADWLASPSNEGIRRHFTFADYEHETVSMAVDSAIVVSAEQSVSETMRLVAECAGSRRVAGVVGWVDLTLDVRDDDVNGLLGIRHSIISESEGWLDRDDVQRGIRKFSGAGLVLELLADPRDLPAIARCADRFPALSIVVDHLGGAPVESEPWDWWRSQMAKLGKRANVRTKLSGERMSADSIAVVLEAFGPSRSMFGSDWPVSMLHLSVAEQLLILQAATSELSTSERDLIFAGTALDTFGLAQ